MEEALSRVMWRLYEPIHASIYFHPRASAVFRDLGLKGGWMGYFATRAAPLGAVSSEVVQALFYNFGPELVSRAIPDAWKYSNPTDMLEARFQLAEDLIHKSNAHLQSEVISNLSRELLDLARSLEVSGRALYGAHLNIDWQRSDALSLFGATTLLREHRGDTHNAALVANGISGIQSHLLQIAKGTVTAEVIFPNRGWSEEDWNRAVNDLLRRGLLESDSTPENPVLTCRGENLKDEIENETDQNSNPWISLDKDILMKWQNDLRAISDNVKRFVNFPDPNPIGV